MKKTILFILCIVLASFTLSGCGSNIHDADTVMIYQSGPRICSITVTNPDKIAELADFFEKLEKTEMTQNNELEVLWGEGTYYIYFMRDGKPIEDYTNYGDRIAFETVPKNLSLDESDIPLYVMTDEDNHTWYKYRNELYQTEQVEDMTYDDFIKKLQELS